MVKKVIMKSVLATVAGVGLMASSAMAVGFSFTGNYTLTNADSDNFLEILSLGTALISQTNFSPSNDGIFYDSGDLTKIETVVFSDFEINESSMVYNTTGDFYTYTFTSPVHEGFQVYNDDGTLLIKADIKLDTIKIDGTVASINNKLTMNLFNITAVNYNSGTSSIIDSFLINSPNYSGATNISLQLMSDFYTAINNTKEDGTAITTESVGNTYSGTAKPIPEPGVTLLFGLGVAGFVGMIRRRNTLAN